MPSMLTLQSPVHPPARMVFFQLSDILRITRRLQCGIVIVIMWWYLGSWKQGS